MKRILKLLILIVIFFPANNLNAQSQSEEELDAMISAQMDSDSKEEAKATLTRHLTLDILERYDPQKLNFQHLELVEPQRVEIQKLKVKYGLELERLKKKHEESVRGLSGLEKWEVVKTFNSDNQKLKREYAGHMSKILLPNQIEVAASFNPSRAGLAKSLVNSSFGNSLGLSEKQKLAIKRKSNLIAQDIHRFVHDTRKKVYSSISEELTPSQLAQLKEYYGEKNFQRYFESSQLGLIFRDNLIDPDVIPTIKDFRTPNHSLLKTKIDFNTGQ